jgi:hypothetical protein
MNSELPDFLGHLVGDFLRAGDRFFRLPCLRVRPFVRGGGNLRGELFEVLDFFGDRAERADFNDLAHRAVIENERQGAENRAERDAGGGDDFPVANRVRRFGRKNMRSAAAARRRAKTAIWEPSNFRVVHRASFGEKRGERKQTPSLSPRLTARRHKSFGACAPASSSIRRPAATRPGIFAVSSTPSARNAR